MRMDKSSKCRKGRTGRGRQLDFNHFYLPLDAISFLFKPGWKLSTSVHGEFCRKFCDVYSLGTLFHRTLKRGSWMLPLFTHQFWKIILNLHYRANKFKFWMRVDWHGNTWCWKPSEYSQVRTEIWRKWRKAMSKPLFPTNSDRVLCVVSFLGPQISSLPCVLSILASIYWSSTVCQTLFWELKI